MGKKIFILILLTTRMAGCPFVWAQTPYFPPPSQNSSWDTLSPSGLGWCTSYIDTLYQHLEQENTRGFLVLKNGRIVLEKYFGTFGADSLWRWASAAKTLTAFLTGKAQEQNQLKITDSTTKYLGAGWTSLTPQQESRIRIRNQLTMTTGLDDGVPDLNCTLSSCLQYLAEPGTRWAYHNAPYTLLGDVLESATGKSLNQLTLQHLRTQTGFQGIWIKSGYNNLFFSTLRACGRFGLLALNNFSWNSTPLLSDTAFIRQSTSSSQTLNPSYGYLWWLNGKSSFMGPGLPFSFPGSWAPDAPADLVAAIGKDGQIISFVKSQGLVVVRIGESNSTSGVPFQICNEIWKRLNLVICGPSAVAPASGPAPVVMPVPNPARGEFTLSGAGEFAEGVFLLDSRGRRFEPVCTEPGKRFSLKGIPAGVYQIRAEDRPDMRLRLICIP